MRLFDGPYPNDFIFLKLIGERQVSFVPLCEAITIVGGATYDNKQSNKDVVFLIERTPEGQSYKMRRQDIIARLQADLYNNTKRIRDYVIQPEGEMQTAEVTEFLEKD